MIAEVHFDLRDFIHKSLKNYDLHLVNGKQPMGKLTADIWVGEEGGYKKVESKP